MDPTPLWKQIVLSALLVAVAGAVWQYRADITALLQPEVAEMPRDRGADGDGVPVLVADVGMADDALTFTAVGTGLALKSVTLRAPAGGEVTRLAITPGARFEAGDILLRLDDTAQRLAVSLAEARQERAASERARYQGLKDTGVTTAQRFEDAMTAYKIASIELDKARDDLADRVLRAPFAGIAGIPRIEVGDRIAQGDVIASYDDRSRILIEFDLPEALLPRAAIGLGVQASTPSAGSGAFGGTITAIDSRVDSASRTARVRAAIDNQSDMLRPGASFTVQIDLPGSSYPVLPELALQFSGGALQVWRVTADGTAEAVTVQMIRRRAGTVLVDGPLDAGDRVIVEGLQRMRPGRAVNVLNTAAPGET